MSVVPTRPELVGNIGMVASTHWLASAVGFGILERGGNAADAAVASGFVLQIVEPHLNGPGGEVPILVAPGAGSDGVDVICGQGVSPRAASVQRFLNEGLRVIPGTGLMSAVVPGAFDAWLVLLERYGTMRLRDVLEPAIHYARRGHPLLRNASAGIELSREMFTVHWPTSGTVWLDGGEVPKAGSNFTNAMLADTYERIVREGEATGGSRESEIEGARLAWYEGFVAEAIERFCRHTVVLDASGSHNGGLLTGDDMASFRATVESPTRYDYGEYRVFKTGPWGQGPVMLQQLAILEAVGLGELRVGSAEWVHTIIEASKLAFADREAWYGDPVDNDVPLTELLSARYGASRAKLISGRASLDLRPGSPGGRVAVLPVYPDPEEASPEGVGLGDPTLGISGLRPGDTCHVDVVDRDGMMISATPSGGWFQSSPCIPGLGFALSTRAQMFWLEEGLPNSLRPGVRPRTTLSPSMAFRDGMPWLAFGTPGADAQDQWSLQLFLNVVHGSHDLQEAIDLPAFRSYHFPSSFFPRYAYPGRVSLEGRFPPEVIADLQGRGHDIVTGGDWSEGRLSAVALDGSFLKAAANPRGRQGYAVGR